jgi:hypothetical protein
VDDARRVAPGRGKVVAMAAPTARTADPALLLRREVGLLRQRETRRVFDLAVYVGTLGGPRDSFVVRARDLPAMDAGLRTDVVAELVEQTSDEQRLAWVVRPGHPEPHDADLHWFAAASAAFAVHGRPLEAFYVITRYGWRDVRTGRARTWKRLRL